MAIRGAVRFKPDTHRSSLEATVAGLDPSATPPSGHVVMVMQLVAYDDAVVTAQNYAAGAESTESQLTILYEESAMLPLEAFQGKSQAQSTAMWTDVLEDFKSKVTPAGPNLVKAIRAARRTPPSLI